MRKWKLVVCGLLFSLLFGMTALAAPEDEVEVVEDVTVADSFTPQFEARWGDVSRNGNVILKSGTTTACKVSIQPVPWDMVRKPIEDDFTYSHKEPVPVHAFRLQLDELQGADGTWYPSEESDVSKGVILMKISCPAFPLEDFGWEILKCNEEGDDWLWPQGLGVSQDPQYGIEDGMFTYRYNLRKNGIYVVNVKDSNGTGQKPVQKLEFRLLSQSATIEGSGDVVDVMLSDTAQELSSDTVQTVLNSGRGYTVYRKDIQLKQNGSPKALDPGQSVVLTFEVPNVSSDSDVRVLHFDSATARWENDTAEIVSKRKNQVTVRFRSLSPVAILVYNQAGQSHSSGSRTKEPENDFWATPLSSGGAVMVNGTAADLQIGPSPRTFSETDARIVLGTTDPCSVYTTELWLLDQATKNIVLPQAGGSDVTINIPGVTKNNNVRVRIWLNGTDEYMDLVPAEIGNGYIRVKMTDMGPVAICVSGNGGAAVPTATETK